MSFDVRVVRRHQVDQPLKALSFTAWISHESIIAILGDDVNSRIDFANLLPTNRFQECRAIAEQIEVQDWVTVDDQPGIVWGSQIPARDPEQRAQELSRKTATPTPFLVV